MEPSLRLADQGEVWSVAYMVPVVLVGASAVFTWRSPPRAAATEPAEGDDRQLTLGRRLRWVFIAFVPSSLMLGATATITTDIAPIRCCGRYRSRST